MMSFVFLFIKFICSKSICLPGSSECKDNSMNICDLKGNWISIDCPNKTVCKLDNGHLACVLKNKYDDNLDVIDKKLAERKEDKNYSKKDSVQDKEDSRKHYDHDEKFLGEDAEKDDQDIENKQIEYEGKNDKSTTDEQESVEDDEKLDDKITKDKNKDSLDYKRDIESKNIEAKNRTITVIKTVTEIIKPKKYIFTHFEPENINKFVRFSKLKKQGKKKTIDLDINEMNNLMDNNDDEPDLITNKSPTKLNLLLANADGKKNSEISSSKYNRPTRESDKKNSLIHNQYVNKTTEFRTPQKSKLITLLHEDIQAGSEHNGSEEKPKYSNKKTELDPSNPNNIQKKNGSNLIKSKKQKFIFDKFFSTFSNSSDLKSSFLNLDESNTGLFKNDLIKNNIQQPQGDKSTIQSNKTEVTPNDASHRNNGNPEPQTTNKTQNGGTTPASKPTDSDKPSNNGVQKSMLANSKLKNEFDTSFPQNQDFNQKLKQENQQGPPPPSGGPQPPTGDKPNGGNITKEELKAALTACGFPSSDDKLLESGAEKISKNIKNKEQTAMFLAQIFHESTGLKDKEELACNDDPEKCKTQYDDKQGKGDKSYHGRGFIQLTWAANYKAASEGLGMGDDLVNNPEKVSNDIGIAFDVAIWFWNNRVITSPEFSEDKFGTTTKAINGALECQGQNVDKSKRRYEFYVKIADALKIEKKASESGCYN